MTPLNYDLYLYQFVCMDDSFKLWCLCGWLTPLNYDLYLYQFVWLTRMTPLNYDLYLYQFVWLADSFKLWSLSLSVCVAGWLL